MSLDPGGTVVVLRCEGCGGRHRIYTSKAIAAAWVDRTGDCRPFSERRFAGGASPFAAVGSNGSRRRS